MASGLPEAKWNNADIVDADADRASIVAWYAERDVPWGLRVPLEVEFELGEPLFVKRCAALVRESFKLAPGSSHSGIDVRRATRDDLGTYAAVELSRFGGTRASELAWLSPALGAPNFTHWIAERSGVHVGVAMTIQTDERAGPAAYLGGVAAVPEEAGRDVEQKLVSVAAQHAFEAGARLVHTNPDEAELAWLTPMGFVEVPGFQVRLVVDAPRRTGPRP